MINEKYLKNAYETINDTRKNLASGEDYLWETLLNTTASALACEAGTFFETDEKMRIMSVKKGIGKCAQDLSSLSFSYQGICGWCASERKSVISNDARHDQRFTSKVDLVTGFVTNAILCVPAVCGKELFGVVELINPAKGDFSAEDLEFVEFLCAQVSMSVRVIRLEQAITRLTHQGENILQNLSGGFIGVDLDGNVMLFNPRARQIFGIGDADLMGKPLSSIKEICPKITEILGEALKTGKVIRRQDFNCTINGASRRIGYSTLLIQDVIGKKAGAGMTFQDITEV